MILGAVLLFLGFCFGFCVGALVIQSFHSGRKEGIHQMEKKVLEVTTRAQEAVAEANTVYMSEEDQEDMDEEGMWVKKPEGVAFSPASFQHAKEYKS